METTIEELTRNESETLKTNILDEEGDALNCEFHYDDCIHIKTKGYSYITLSKNNLYKMIELIEEAEEVYDFEGV